MDVQNACLTKIVQDGNLLPFIESKITAEFFTDDKHAQVWKLVLEHYKSHGKPPSEEAVHKAYPTYVFEDCPEPISYYLNQLKQDRKKVILIRYAQEFLDRVQEEEGPNIGDDLELILRQGMSQAAHEISQGRDTDFFLSQDRIIERLRERRLNPNTLKGITTGLNGIDALTSGLQPEQLITMIGTPKAGKSSILLKMALNAHRNGNPVLFITFEMSTEEQEDRLLSLLSGIGLTKILTGGHTSAEEKMLERMLDIRKGMSGFTFTSDVTSAITVSGVQAKIQQYQPALVIVDGVYLMDDESGNDKGTPQALTSITRGFKRLAQTLRIPIVISTQAMLYRSKGGLKMESIGYSSSFAQDSDIVFGVEAHEQFQGVSKFKVIASRSSPKGEVHVRFDWSQGMIEEITAKDYETMLNNQTPPVSSSSKPKPSSLHSHWEEEDEGAA
jgi:replicative DNA helicase